MKALGQNPSVLKIHIFLACQYRQANDQNKIQLWSFLKDAKKYWNEESLQASWFKEIISWD